jgi:hypothetical protein
MAGGILGIQFDSSSTIGDMVESGELSMNRAFISKVKQVPPALSKDLSFISARYTLSLADIASELFRHSSPRTIWGPLVPSPARAYTGIIIIADEELPIHGRAVRAFPKPCLFPKIWDSGMNIVYERNVVDPEKNRDIVRYTSRESIMLKTPSGMDKDLIAIVGDKPLRIIAQEVFGAAPTDPVIASEDAMVILSSEENRRLLSEGRVVIVINNSALKEKFGD